MCTVTIIPKDNYDFVLTSNRDEAPDRESLVPNFYNINETKLLFPKDKMGGTWIGVSEKKRVVCVLNGGFVKHERKSSYRMSRGIVANDFMVSDNIVTTIGAYNLEDVEPFTIVIADWNTALKFYELVWDGKNKYFIELPVESRIWSSSTLYSEGMQRERKQWFEDFEVLNNLNADAVLEFHSRTDAKNMDYGVVMNRGFVKTMSITQVEKRGDAIGMRYESLENKLVTIKTFNLTEAVNG